MVGLGNVDNTADADKPISSATQQALNAKANQSDVSAKVGGSGTATYLSKFTDARVLANSCIQENAYNNIGIGGTPDNYYRMRVAGTLYVDDVGTPNGVVLAAQTELRPLITRSMNPFSSGNKAPYIGRWGLYMEHNELFLASPGTDLNSGSVSIGGYLADCTKQPNLTVNNYTRMVGIGTSTPTSKLHVSGAVTASSFVKSGGDETQYLMADGSTSSFPTARRSFIITIGETCKAA
jgi:hypothetical protein